MSLYFKIILVIFGLAYFISPVDIIPDLLLPYVGWIDDGVVFATIIYMIRYGRLPYFLFKNKMQSPKTNPFNSADRPYQSNQNAQKKTKTGSNSNNRSNYKSGPSTQKKQTRPSKKTPYDILGVKKNVTKEQLNSAYKEAIKKYHPDKLSHLGEEFSTLANKKFLEIQRAYDTLLKKFNLRTADEIK